MFERPAKGTRALLVSLDIGSSHGRGWHEEFVELATSAGAEVVGVISGRRHTPTASLFVGSGKAEEIKAQVQGSGAEVVIFNHSLTPAQERNLERLLQCRVLERTGLILDIFAQRARTFEGKLQVELAQLRHLSARLVRGWTHLERQRGGIGLRGPGETQLELDRRMLGRRIQYLTERLRQVESQRRLHRAGRKKASIPLVAIVGYTNAGKSTLFNALTGANALAVDQLFATLDPTLRRLDINGMPIIVADTVGFIRDLPHELVAAFKATLEETREADLLLRVSDAADPEHGLRDAEVDAVLQEIGADAVPCLHIRNKIDLLEEPPRLTRDGEGRPHEISLSAAQGLGLDLLKQALAECFMGGVVEGWIRLPMSASRARARLFAQSAVLEENALEDGWLLKIRLTKVAYEDLCQKEHLMTSLMSMPLHPEQQINKIH